MGLNRAVVLIAEKKGGTKVLRELGAHPEGGEPVRLRSGRYGPYVQHRRLRASLPKGASAEDLTLEQAVALLAAKAKKGGAKKTAGGRRKAAATKSGGARRGKAKRAPSRQPDAPAGGAP